MKLSRPFVALAFVALAAAGGAAQARDNVYWSVGIDAAPGVTLGIGNTRPAVVAPAPVYVVPQPVYVVPTPVYVAPWPAYVSRPVVLVQPAPVYYHAFAARPGKHKGKHRHKRHRRDWD